MQETEPGLRERQRRESFERIHEAALALAHADGLQATTVEAIAEAAGVSRRTFFNYYPSKEDAILGTAPLAVPQAALDAFLDDRSDPDRLSRTVHLLLTVLTSSRRYDSTDRVRQLVCDNPALAVRLRDRAARAQELVLAALDPDGTVTDDSRAMVMLAGAIIRFVTSPDGRPPEIPDDAELDSAITLFRSILEDAA